jgi:hypothetical protein
LRVDGVVRLALLWPLTRGELACLRGIVLSGDTALTAGVVPKTLVPPDRCCIDRAQIQAR